MVSNAQVKPFPFARIFSEPLVEAVTVDEQALNARIAALEADCARLRAEHEAALAVARAEAFQQGLDHARGERETALLAAVDALQASVEAMEEGLGEVEVRLAGEAGELALAAADLLAARALEQDPTAAIDEAIGRALGQVQRGQSIRIRVHPDLVADLERLVTERQANERRRLSLIVFGDDKLSLGDASLQWDQGGLRLDADARRRAIRAELEGILAPA
ncbi:FliH/SctL family protein [Novosphingobium sp. M1R2S20]|uniref:Flagellar assembly protein FliH n=1 Tax=Novosphingobium rhizovicinum TaxID=3228928 RepID=A0ABV3RB41_9SPHN